MNFNAIFSPAGARLVSEMADGSSPVRRWFLGRNFLQTRQLCLTCSNSVVYGYPDNVVPTVILMPEYYFLIRG